MESTVAVFNCNFGFEASSVRSCGRCLSQNTVPASAPQAQRGASACYLKQSSQICRLFLLVLMRSWFFVLSDIDHLQLSRGLALSTSINSLVSNITCIRLRREFVWLAVILDACSRRCIDLGGSDFTRPSAIVRRLSLKLRFHHQYFLNCSCHFRGALQASKLTAETLENLSTITQQSMLL